MNLSHAILHLSSQPCLPVSALLLYEHVNYFSGFAYRSKSLSHC